MFELFQYEFVQNALIAGFLAAFICGVVGSLVVVNRMIFLAGGVAHASYGGIGMALFWNLPFMLSVLGFTVLAAVIMALFMLKARNRADTFIGALWAIGMSFGIILLDFTPGYNADLMSYLFGSILTVSHTDLIYMLVVLVISIGFTAFFYNDILAVSYDGEFSGLRGIPVTFLYVAMVVIMALSIVVIIRVVGLIMVIALLSMPPFIAERYSSSLKSMMARSCLLSLACVMLGLGLAYRFDITSGAAIIMVTAIFFVVNFAWTARHKRRLRPKTS